MTATMAQLLGELGQVQLTMADHYTAARERFAERDYGKAAQLLETVVEEQSDSVAARLLLARSYYHAARLGPAEEQAREVVARNPGEAYAHLLLGRTLQRQNRHEEAEGPLRLAEAMGLEA